MITREFAVGCLSNVSFEHLVIREPTIIARDWYILFGEVGPRDNQESKGPSAVFGKIRSEQPETDLSQYHNKGQVATIPPIQKI